MCIYVGNLLERVLLLCRHHNVKLDAKFIQVICAIGIVEGVIKRLDPSMDILSKAIPYIMKASVQHSVKNSGIGSHSHGLGKNSGMHGQGK